MEDERKVTMKSSVALTQDGEDIIHDTLKAYSQKGEMSGSTRLEPEDGDIGVRFDVQTGGDTEILDPPFDNRPLEYHE